MRRLQTNRIAGLICVIGLVFGVSARAFAQDVNAAPAEATTTTAQDATKSSFEIYGFAMLDIGHDFKQIHPNWFDTMRWVCTCA